MRTVTAEQWHVGLKPGPIVYTSEGEQIVNMMDDPFHSKAETLDIARRIASAPDLAIALEDLVNLIEAGCSTKVIQNGPCIRAAKAALAPWI